MKTLIQPLLVALSFSLVTVTTSLAATPSTDRPTRPAVTAAYKTSIYTTAEGKLNIALDKETGGTVIVRLTNSLGKEFFAKRIGKHEKVARLRLDVSGLPDGTYQVAITNGVEMTTHTLTLATQQPVETSRLVAIN